MFRDSRGRPNAMLTAAALGLGVVLVRYALAGVTLVVAGYSLTVGVFDAAGASAILGATFTAYVMRRYHDGKVEPNSGETK